MVETWRPVEGFEGLYEISDKGRVRNRHGRVLKGAKDVNGYYQIILQHKNHRRDAKLHRLVAEHYLPKGPFDTNVVHLDGNKENNNAYNLMWMTAKEAFAFNVDNGYIVHGRTGKKLTADHKAKISKANRGRHHTEETKAKISRSLTGQERTPEQRERIRKATIAGLARKREKERNK